MAPKARQLQQHKKAKLSWTRELINECTACFTDSLFTQFCLTLCYFMFHRIGFVQNYFKHSTHIYWIFYFIHCNIIDSYVWGSTYRNSINYIHAKSKTQSLLRSLSVVLIQYASIFAGVYFCIQIAHVYYGETNPSLALELQYQFVGTFHDPDLLSSEQLTQFVWQSLLFQVGDRMFEHFVTSKLAPFLKRRTAAFDGTWTLITARCILMHLLTVNGRMGVILNANYAIYASLFYWRWTLYDWIVLLLPYSALLIYHIITSITAAKRTKGRRRRKKKKQH